MARPSPRTLIDPQHLQAQVPRATIDAVRKLAAAGGRSLAAEVRVALDVHIDRAHHKSGAPKRT